VPGPSAGPGECPLFVTGEANLDGTGVNQNFITGAAGPIGVAISP
jgi:hypothetical protein